MIDPPARRRGRQHGRRASRTRGTDGFGSAPSRGVDLREVRRPCSLSHMNLLGPTELRVRPLSHLRSGRGRPWVSPTCTPRGRRGRRRQTRSPRRPSAALARRAAAPTRAQRGRRHRSRGAQSRTTCPRASARRSLGERERERVRGVCDEIFGEYSRRGREGAGEVGGDVAPLPG